MKKAAGAASGGEIIVSSGNAPMGPTRPPSPGRFRAPLSHEDVGEARKLRREATRPEDFLWEELSNRRFGGDKFKPQMPIDRHVVDFRCIDAGIGVEIDGRQHEALAEYDAERSDTIRYHGFEVVRFTNSEIMRQPAPALARLKMISDRASATKNEPTSE